LALHERAADRIACRAQDTGERDSLCRDRERHAITVRFHDCRDLTTTLIDRLHDAGQSACGIAPNGQLQAHPRGPDVRRMTRVMQPNST
jgi:hypothetical protein